MIKLYNIDSGRFSLRDLLLSSKIVKVVVLVLNICNHDLLIKCLQIRIRLYKLYNIDTKLLTDIYI